LEGIDGEAAIFAEHPAAEMLGLLAGFESGVGGEGFAGFFGFDGVRQIGQRDDFKAVRGEELGEFDAFFAVVSAEDEVHGECGVRKGRVEFRIQNSEGGIRKAERIMTNDQRTMTNEGNDSN
jgi:hypothetical protein